MDINNISHDEHTRHLADQLIHSRLGQWSHIPGVKTVLKVKFLSQESEMILGKSFFNIDMDGIGAFTSEEERLAKMVLDTLKNEIGIDFQVVEDDSAHITFANCSKLISRTPLNADELAQIIEDIKWKEDKLVPFEALTKDRFAQLSTDKKTEYEHLKEELETFIDWRDFGYYNHNKGYTMFESHNPDLLHPHSPAVNRGNFVGTIPILVTSLSILGKDEFISIFAHELGHALGLPHLIDTQQQNKTSTMTEDVLEKEALAIFNQLNPHNGFGKADLLALKAIYSMDKNKPVDLFYRGEVHYRITDGHASISPVGCARLGLTPEDETHHNKKNEIIRLQKGLTPDNIRITLLESASGIKLTFIDHPDASLTIKERSEPLIHGDAEPLRFKNIKLADGKTLSIDDQLYQALEEGKPLQWQAGIPLVVGKLLPSEVSHLESYEFSLTDNQGDVAIKHFNLNTDKLLIPELAGRQLHILSPGEKLSPDQHNEKHVIFRQKNRVSFDQKNKRYKLEFVLTHFDAQGARSNIFINISQTPEIYNKLYKTNELTKENIFLPSEILKKIHNSMNINNEYTRHLADQLIHSRLGQWPHTPGVKTVLKVKFLSQESEMKFDFGEYTLSEDEISHYASISGLGAFTSEEKRLAMKVLDTLEKEIGIDFQVVEDDSAHITLGHYSTIDKRTPLQADELEYTIGVIKTIEDKLALFEALTKDQLAQLTTDEKVKYKDLKEELASYIDWRDSGNYDNSQGFTIFPSLSPIMNYGNFVGSIPIWITSLSILGKNEFISVFAHELGHALGLDHLTEQQQENGKSMMSKAMLKGEELSIFNQHNPNNGLGNADLLALKAIYSMDKDKPVDLFHRGKVHYSITDGHASISPVGTPEYQQIPEKQIIWLHSDITQDNVQVTLLKSASTPAIKLTFTDQPDASLIIKERSETVIHDQESSELFINGGNRILRFDSIRLANGQMLLIDNQLYQTLKAGKTPQWQAGVPLVTKKLLASSTPDLESYEFSFADTQGEVVVNQFKLNTDKLFMPELAGRQLHILTQGENVSLNTDYENNVIFHQREIASFDPKTNLYKLEFVLIRLDKRGLQSKVFIDISQTPNIYNQLYANKILNKDNVFLPRETLQEIYLGLGSLDMVIQAPITELIGTDGGDILCSSQGKDALSGGKGHDQLLGGGGNDSLNGGEGNDIIEGGQGNDILEGGEGSDTYMFDKGFGQDIIYSTENKADDKDRLVFNQDISKRDLILKRQNLDLQIILTPQDRVTINNFYLSGSNTIQEIIVDGYKLSKSDITGLADAMVTFNSTYETNSELAQNKLQVDIDKYWQSIITTKYKS